ncbi:type II toxin-antitoxin system RelB/DinJ family antitoxin [Aestuariirhabdus litorea]|uniref:Type II toxin-antitoxin system RelB/DinJ family antitoxin n=1 Tax=Aestuariirhabdus litorea TaxID=2528527 RepID=A0A3P3VK59_9GAMM|nr:type II toxin-antitoxin system RelB/DinJ family antitoxin [Aestuariirhabdus litorea]RRJ82764.1 type II toxin-antitoxin system RelB/DinJ family antitoxin [Aestuariirhabdus litorea]RWW92925.1 type II toxin-antitoxin system RelB/DinJ family antitoxin [Endozoicomonadaceae bacterium GTF-13]
MSTMKTEIVRARIEPEIKADAEQVLEQIGMSMADAIRLFVTQVARRQEFPIELRVTARKPQD